MEKVVWGMIGCGQVTEVKSGPGLYKAEYSELKGVYNLDYDIAFDYCKRHNISVTYKTVEHMLADDEINIIYIATPPAFHKEYAIKILRAGKIPYIEKPIALNYEDALEVKKVAEEVGITPYVAFYRRGDQKFTRIKELLDENVIGKVNYVEVKQIMQVEDNELDPNKLPWRVIEKISGGGKFLDMAVHVLDCLVMYFGDIVEVNGFAENNGGYYEVEDTVVASFRFKNGVLGTGSWCYVADHNENSVKIVGDKGHIKYDGLSAKKFTLYVDGTEEVYHFPVPMHASMPFQQDVVFELIGKKQSHANFDEAVNLVHVTDQILRSFKEKNNQ